MIEQHAGPTPVVTAHSTVNSCLLLANAIPVSQLPVEAIKEGLNKFGPHDPAHGWRCSSLAFFALRRGDYAEAREWIERCHESRTAHDQSSLRALSMVIEAVALAGLGMRKEAQEVLENASETIVADLQALYDGSTVYHWHILLMAEILRREASALLAVPEGASGRQQAGNATRAITGEESPPTMVDVNARNLLTQNQDANAHSPLSTIDTSRFEHMEVTADNAKLKAESEVVTEVAKGERLAVLKRDGPWVGVVATRGEDQYLGWILVDRVRPILPPDFDARVAPPDVAVGLEYDVKHTQLVGVPPTKLCFELSVCNRDGLPLTFDSQAIELRVNGTPLARLDEAADAASVSVVFPEQDQFSKRTRIGMPRPWTQLLKWNASSTIAPEQTKSGWLAFDVPITFIASQNGTEHTDWTLNLPSALDVPSIDFLELERRNAVKVRECSLTPSITVVEIGARINALNVGVVINAFERVWSEGKDCIVLYRDANLLIDTSAMEQLKATNLAEGWKTVTSYWVNRPRVGQGFDETLSGGPARLGVSEQYAALRLLSCQEDAWTYVLKLLEDPDPEVRRSASGSARRYVHRVEIMDALASLVTEEDPKVRTSALYAMAGRYTSGPFSSPLSVLSPHRDAKMPESVVDGLLLAAKDEAAGVRSAALGVLQHISDPRATEAVVHAFEDPDMSVRMAAARAAAGHTAEKVIPALTKMMNNAQSYETSGFMGIQSQTHPALVACQSLARVGDKSCIPKLNEYSRHSDPQTAKSAVETLVELGEIAEAEGAMLKVESGVYLQDDEKALLADAKTPQRVERLKKVAESGESGIKAETALCVLAEMGETDALEPLLNKISTQSRINSQVPEALGKLGDERAVEPLKKALESQTGSARNGYLHALLMLNVPGIRDKIIAELQSPPDRAQVWGLLTALIRAEGDGAIPHVEPFLADQASHLTALGLLNQMGTPEAMKAIERAATTEDNPNAEEIVHRLGEDAAQRIREDESSREAEVVRFAAFLETVAKGANVRSSRLARAYLKEMASTGDKPSPQQRP